MLVDASSSPELEITAFNFSRAGLIAGDQMRILRTLDEQFARNLTHTLGAWLRSNVTIAPLPAEQQSFGRFAEHVAEGGCYMLPLSVRMDTQHVRGAFSLSLTLAPAIIDLLLGGSGRVGSNGRELTEIEEAVLDSVIGLILREWSTAWAPFDLEFAAGQRERDNHGRRLMPLHEKVFCCRFQVTLADLAGELVFCLPSTSLISTLRLSSSKRDQQHQRTPEERTRMLNRLRPAVAKAALCFPNMRLHASDLRSLQAGSLLPLPLSPGVTAELRISGLPVLGAVPVRSGSHRAAQIAQPLQEAPALEAER